MASRDFYLKAGLTNDEAEAAIEWEQSQDPNASRPDVTPLGSMYALGYSCQEIHEDFSDYSLPLLLWARATFRWDELRDAYRKNLFEQTELVAITSRSENIRFLAELLTATRLRYRAQVRKFIAHPNQAEAPACLPKDMDEYAALSKLFEDLIHPKSKSDGGSTLASSPLVTIQLGQSPDQPPVSVSQDEVKNTLIEEMKTKRKSRSA